MQQRLSVVRLRPSSGHFHARIENFFFFFFQKSYWISPLYNDEPELLLLSYLYCSTSIILYIEQILCVYTISMRRQRSRPRWRSRSWSVRRWNFQGSPNPVIQNNMTWRFFFFLIQHIHNSTDNWIFKKKMFLNYILSSVSRPRHQQAWLNNWLSSMNNL